MKFVPLKNERYSVRWEAADGKESTIGKMVPQENGDYLFESNEKDDSPAISAEAIRDEFLKFMGGEEEPAETIPPEPARDPVHGTAGLEYMEWAAVAMSSEHFAQLYDYRWAKPSFREYAATCEKFIARAQKEFPQ